MIARTIRSTFSSTPIYYVAGFLLIALLLLAKNPYLYVYPPLYDDLLLIQHHVNNPGNVFYFYNGYFALVPSVMAKLSIALFPLKWIPRIFAIASLLTCTLTIWLFCLDWYAPLISSRNARLTIATLIAIQPIGNWPLQATLVFQIYNFIIIIIHLLVAEQYIDNLKWLFMTVIILMFTWSNPMSVCFLPVFILSGIRAFQQKNMVRLGSYLILCINVPIYIYKGIIQKDVPMMNQFYCIATSSLVTGFERILLDSFFPSKLRIIVREEYQLLPMAIAFFIFIFLCFLVLKATVVNRNIRRLSVLTAYTCLTVTVFSVAIRFRTGIPWYLVEKSFRYFYVQQYCLLLLFLISAYLLIRNIKQYVKILSVLMAFVLVIAAAVTENYRYHYKEIPDEFLNAFNLPLSFRRESLYERGLKVAACLDRAQDSAATQETLVCEDLLIRLNFGRNKKK